MRRIGISLQIFKKVVKSVIYLNDILPEAQFAYGPYEDFLNAQKSADFDENTVYWITDKFQIYKGKQLYATNVGQVTPQGGEIFSTYSGSTVNSAPFKGSSAFGLGTKSGQVSQFVLGQYNLGKTSTVLEVGGGSSNTSRLNFFEVYADGHAEVQTQGTTDKSIVIESELTAQIKSAKDYSDAVVAEVDTKVNTKLDKVTSPASVDRIYGILSDGSQTTFNVGKDATAANYIPMTNLEGRFNINPPVYDNNPTTKKYVDTAIGKKQDTLVSGTSIKTINGNSLLGSGNINIEGGSTITVDSTLSTTSTNPVQNKVITNAVNKKQELFGNVDNTTSTLICTKATKFAEVASITNSSGNLELSSSNNSINVLAVAGDIITETSKYTMSYDTTEEAIKITFK